VFGCANLEHGVQRGQFEKFGHRGSVQYSYFGNSIGIWREGTGLMLAAWKCWCLLRNGLLVRGRETGTNPLEAHISCPATSLPQQDNTTASPAFLTITFNMQISQG
jgi:hypothetical protein